MSNETINSYFGIISISTIENCWSDLSKRDEVLEMNSNHCRYVHYPDCQQLIIWLPVYGVLYDSMDLIVKSTKHVVWKKNISELLNGSVQIILNTLPFPPEEYHIMITKLDGLIHQITFTKYAEGISPQQEVIINQSLVDLDAPPIEYRDGFGNLLPNEDFILRDAVIKKTMDIMTRRLE